jgi:Rrf2 family protein
VHISARTDYAVRAMLVLAGAHPRLVKATEIATAQQIPTKFLTTILVDLRRGGLVSSLRGSNGGHGLARPPEQISVGDILRVADGTLTTVGGRADHPAAGPGLRDMWRMLDTAITDVVDHVLLAHLVARSRTDLGVEIDPPRPG